METAGSQVGGDFPFRRGDAIDRFTVLEPLGVGGMGIVVSAYDCTLDRKVAIKVLRPDRLTSDPEQGRTRLLREAQAMARLRHANVITVYEVGTLGDQVFVAMELVEGETLAQWLRSAERSWREVVQRFVAAGRGLAAAHRAGLVHRDFKPDNVLVGADDEVRVTDFGLAGVSDEVPLDPTGIVLEARLTRTGTRLGTPAYMSPEQHRGARADERSDQFSFSVALHEALYGVPPFAGDTSSELLDAITARRFSAPRRDAPRWLRPIVLRGLEANPDDRWPTMEPLLAALQRDPAATRRRWLLLGGAAALAAIAGVAVAPREQPALCQGASARVAPLWDGRARDGVRAAFVATGSPIAADVFGRVDRLLGQRLEGWASAHTDACRATHVRGEQSIDLLDLRMQCLERARRQIASLVDVWARQPIDLEKALEAAATVGEVTPCADTEALAMPVPPPRDPVIASRIEAVRAQIDRVEALESAGQLTAALALARAAVAAATPLDHPPIIAEALDRNAYLEAEAGQLETGARLFYRAAHAAAEARDDVLGARILVRLLTRLGEDPQRSAEATVVSHLGEAAVARAGNRDELLAELRWAQALLLQKQSKYVEAEERVVQALPLYERRYGAQHVFVSRALNRIAHMRSRMGRLDEAVQLHRRALAMQEQTLGREHPSIVNTLDNLAHALSDLGRYEQASPLLERGLAIREKTYPAGHRKIAFSLTNLASLRGQHGHVDQARPLLERAEKMLTASLGPDHPDTLSVRQNLAMVATATGAPGRARRLLESVIAAKRRTVGAQHESVALSLGSLGQACLADRDSKGAEAAFAESVSILRKQGGHPPKLVDALVGLAHARIAQRRHADAISSLEEAGALDVRLRGDESSFLADHGLSMGEAYLGARRSARAVETLTRALAAAEKKPAGKVDLGQLRFALARALWASGARARARELAVRARGELSRERERDRVDRWLRSRR